MACGAISESVQLSSRWRLLGLQPRWTWLPAALAPVEPFQGVGRQNLSQRVITVFDAEALAAPGFLKNNTRPHPAWQGIVDFS
jgi:hypothetical protein